MRLIDADDFKGKLLNIQSIIKMLDQANTVYVPHWLPINVEGGTISQCSVCGTKVGGEGTPYCPACGAKMAKEDEQ